MQRATFSKLLTYLFAPCLALVSAAPALAQTPIGPGVRDDGWVSGVAGASFGSQVQPDSTFAVEYGDDMSRNAQAYLTLSFFENVMPQSLSDQLSALSADLTATTGTAWDLVGRDQAVSLIAGARYSFLSPGSVRPYAGAGAGIINLKRTIADPRVGNVTAAVLNEFGVGELSLATNSTTKPLVEGALGVAFYQGPVYIDVGYRYRRAFRISGETLQFSAGSVGIGYRF